MAVGCRRLIVAATCVAGVIVGGLGVAAQSGEPAIQLQIGDLLLGEGRFREAVEAYRRARTAAKGRVRVEARQGLVKALLRTSEFRDAREEARLLLEERPGDPETLALFGDTLWSAGLFEEAETQYQAARDASSLNPRARNGLARVLAARARLADALEEAQSAVSLPGADPEYFHTLGYVFERLRRYDDAAEAFTAYVSRLKEGERSERAIWTKQQIRFLQSFQQLVPMAMDPTVADAVHTVPFRVVRDKVVVRARLNGGRAFDLVLDTGAELAVLTKDTARRAAVRPIVYTLSAGVGQMGMRGLQVGRIDRLEVGSLVVENVPTLIKDPPLREFPRKEADSFSPLSFGLSVSVDYGRRLLTMARALPELPADTTLALRMHRLALVRGLVSRAGPVHFVVDTGGEVISISRATFDAIGQEPPRRIPLRVYGTSGRDPDAFLMPGLDLAFDRVHLPKLSVVVLNLDAPSALLGFELGGIVGHRFLSKYRADIDLARSQLRLAAL